MSGGLLLLFLALQLPCDAACHARMAEPTPWWPLFVMMGIVLTLQNLPFIVAAWYRFRSK